MPPALVAAILKAKDRWLDSNEIAAVLEHVLTMDSLSSIVSDAPPHRPAGKLGALQCSWHLVAA